MFGCWGLGLNLGCAKDASEHLTSRASHQLEVLPSLSIRPFVRPGTSRISPYTIGIEVSSTETDLSHKTDRKHTQATNSAVDAEVVIHQISSVSSRWQCRLLDSMAEATPLGTIRPQQITNIALSVVEAPEPAEEQDGVAFSVRKLDDLLQGKDVTKSVPGDVTLHTGCVHPVSRSSCFSDGKS